MTVNVTISSMSERNARASATFINNGATTTLSYDSDVRVSQDVLRTGSSAVTKGPLWSCLALSDPVRRSPCLTPQYSDPDA